MNYFLNGLSEHTQVFSAWVMLLVFIGGVFSSLSPCTIGMLPLVMGYAIGKTHHATRKTIGQVICFVLGLCFVLTILGIIAAGAGKVLGFYSNPSFGLILSSLIMVMGLDLLEIIQIPIPSIIKKMPENHGTHIFLYPFILGGAFALASTPCSTPVLAGIMAYASLKANLFYGGILLFCYALGQSFILVIAGLFSSLFRKISIIKTYSAFLNKISGTILILTAVYLYLKIFEII